MSVQIQLRRANSSDWTSKNPVLAQGEIAVELDTYQFKIGDGVRTWINLPYAGLVGAPGPQGPPGLAALNVDSPLIYDPVTNTLSVDNPVESLVIDAGNF